VEDVVARMLHQTGLEERAGDQVSTLSGGNRQRVNIAIGLLSQPPVLLLDEPSAALDPRQRGRLWEFIRALAETGTAVLFSTHNVAEAERNAHRVIVLADGELLFEGSAADLEAEVGSGSDFETAFVAFLRKRGH
jgi:ABC-2 type transport system ATP-binding protein